MTLIEKLNNLNGPKFAFGKSDNWHREFSQAANANSMYLPNFGLGIPGQLSPENQLRAVFRIINEDNGYFIFNICGVDLDKAIAGFESYAEAEGNNMITEWELSILLQNLDYLEKTIFHNGRTELSQFEGGIEIRWN